MRIDAITSSGFTVHWEAEEGSGGYELWLGVEPPGENGRLERAVALDRLPPEVRHYPVSGLAADSHAFVQVRAKGRAEAEPSWGSAHLRLPRGEASPAGALVSAYAVAPDTLGLVIRQRDLAFSSGKLVGDQGGAWQAGSWEVARATSGATLGVERTMRHTVVAGQGNLPVGFDRHAPATVHLEHRIYLRLASPIGARELLRISHRGAPNTELDVLFPFSDRYAETPVIQVNQVGYNPHATKRFAYVYGWLGDGGPLRLDRFPKQAVVLTEPVDPLAPRSPALEPLALLARPGQSADIASPVRQLDLSRLPAAEGVRYRVHVPGVGVSYPTAVSEQASFKAFSTIARGLFHNRWCGDLRPELTEWSRPADHCSAYFVGGRTEGFFPKDTARTSKRPVRGGHHDAGDFDIRPLHVLVGQTLLRAFELGGEARFGDGQLLIPESGNGVPDLLDEALWSVAAWEQLQDPDGSVRLGIESTRHPPGYYLAHEDELPYFAYDTSPAHTAYVAGLFAQASYLLRPYDPARSQRLLQAAKRAVDYATQNDAPETYLAYAWGELARAGESSKARGTFEDLWRSVNVHGRGLFDDMQPAVKVYPGSIYSQHPAMADFVMAYLQLDDPSPSIRHVATGELRRWADVAARSLLESPQPHRGARPAGARPDWGMEVSQGRYLDGVYQVLQLGGLTTAHRQRYFDALSLAADAMLGCNPAGMSYVTGLGSRSPGQPLHLDSLAFQSARGLPPIPGLVVYGPVESMPGAHYYQPLAAGFYPPFQQQPRALRYVDAAHAVNMSEFSVWESQAPAVLLFAALLPEGLEPWPELAPGQPEHKSPLPPHSRP